MTEEYELLLSQVSKLLACTSCVNNVENNNSQELSIQPNPADNSLIIDYHVPEGKTLQAVFFNQAGQEVRRIDMKREMQLVDVSLLAPGRYNVTILDGAIIKEAKSIIIAR